MEIKFDLGAGLKVAHVQLDELKEQDINARAMSKAMFDGLVKNIKKGGRLESLPLCALTDTGIEIISGHHRIRAARSAGLGEVYVILDDTGMDRDRIRSKQLSHNSIQGDDNQQIVKQIYEMIEDADAKIDAFIDSGLNIKYDIAKIGNVAIDLDIKTVLIAFLTYEESVFKRAADTIKEKFQELYVAEIKHFEAFKNAVAHIGGEYEIRAMSTILCKMAELALESMGEAQPTGERRAIRDIFGTAYIPSELAETVKSAVDIMAKHGRVPNKEKWRALELLIGGGDAENGGDTKI